MAQRRVAIIGAGLSGAAVAIQLARLGRRAPQIVLIERRKRFGPGLAYAGADRAHCLNVRASNLSLFPDRPDDFAKWLKRRGGAPDSFAPRGLYGQYLRARLERAGMFGAIKLVRGDAVACGPWGGGWRIALADGRNVDVDAAVLALGNPAPGQIAAFAEAGVDLIDPWAGLRAAPPGDALLIGTGLTMIDAALTLARRKRGTITALSYRGLLPRPHAQPLPSGHGAPAALPAALSDAVHALRRDAEAATARGEPWQWTIDRLRSQTPQLWRGLPPEAQARFLRHARPWWDVHRHRAAPEIAEKIEALRASGRLRMLAGEIVAVEKNARKIDVHYRQRGGMARAHAEFAFAVNCTGAELDPRRSADPLVRQLIDEGVARAHPTGLGLDVDDAGVILSGAGAAQPNLYALGPITQGAFWESTAAPEIRAAAAALAQRLANRVSPRP